jgi:hypothetical protein
MLFSLIHLMYNHLKGLTFLFFPISLRPLFVLLFISKLSIDNLLKMVFSFLALSLFLFIRLNHFLLNKFLVLFFLTFFLGELFCFTALLKIAIIQRKILNLAFLLLHVVLLISLVLSFKLL